MSYTGVIAASRRKVITGGAVTPIYEDSSTATSVLSTTNNVNYNGTINTNDILYIQLHSNENVVFTPPAGWNLVHQSASNASIGIYWKRAIGSESGTEAFTHNGAGTDVFFGVMHRFSGCVTTGTPFEDNQNQVAGQQTTHIIQSMTSTSSNRLAVGFIMVGDNRTLTVDAVDYTQVYTQKTTVGADAWLLVYTQEKVVAGLIASNFIDFDQTEYGGTVNFLLIPV